MTVVGKGGRPRKWRSDTDRVRAYRARQRGAEEPPTVDEALDGGDDAALAWNRVRELECALEDLRRETKLSKASAREARKALDHERVRFGWINEENISAPLRNRGTPGRAGRAAGRANHSARDHEGSVHAGRTDQCSEPRATPAGGTSPTALDVSRSHTLDHTHLAM